MTRQEKLVSLLQPKEYKSKIKLFCREKRIETEIKFEKLAPLENKQYISRIEIIEKKL